MTGFGGTLLSWAKNTVEVLREFAKLRAMRAMRARMVYVLTCQGANVPKVCQLLIFTFARKNETLACFWHVGT